MTTWTYYPCPKCGATDRVCEVEGGCVQDDPCLICGAPINRDGDGHDDGCMGLDS